MLPGYRLHRIYVVFNQDAIHGHCTNAGNDVRAAAKAFAIIPGFASMTIDQVLGDIEHRFGLCE
jgi:hypothetical protein